MSALVDQVAEALRGPLNDFSYASRLNIAGVAVRAMRSETAGNWGYGKEPCPCGRCHKWFLTGIGDFVQGSGFSEDEADLILAARTPTDAATLARSREEGL